MKRLCAWMLSGLLLIPAVPARAAQWPVWAEEALTWGREHDISGQWLDGPEDIVTRGMAVQLLYEAAGSPEPAAACPFADVPEAFSDAAAWAAEQGYITGVGEARYEPDRPVTRQEFAALLYRQAGSPDAAAQDMDRYLDGGTVSEWARDGVIWSLQAGLMTGRSQTWLAPADHITVAEGVMLLKRNAELPDVSGLRADLEALTAAHRPVGSQGEASAAAYLKERFAEMGYAVEPQPYTDDQGRKGTNVVAVKRAEDPDADILLLSAHHDSVPTAYGANDNASGVAALLYTAQALRDVPTDTEVRFVSFTDEENGKNGSRAYVESLTEAEKERMIGDIQFDMLGGLGSQGTMLCTTDGMSNWVSDLLQKGAPDLTLGAEAASDHASLQLAGVPSVLVMQNGRGYLYHSAADTAGQLDPYAIAGGAELVLDGVREILSPDTPSYRALARAQGDGYTYRQTRQSVIYFGSSLADTEAYLGAAGRLVDSREVSGNGWTDVYDTYLYSMRWFGGETPIHTYYQYRNGFLSGIVLRPEETGYTAEQVEELLTAMYGVPTSRQEDGPSWADPIYSKYISLSRDEEGCKVTISNYSVGITNVLSSYPVTGGEARIDDPEDRAVWEYLCSILPLEARQKIAQFDLYTDGYSNVLAYTSPMRENGVADNTRFSISIDYYDVYDENGAPRDWSKLTYTILHEYGHVLLEDETQVDLTVGTGTHDPAGFVPGSFRRNFYDRFWAGLGDSAVSDYEENPTHYVSRYGANYFHEDIADTFAVFVLGSAPEGTTVAEDKLRFFWADPEMTALRSAIREDLGLELPPAAQTPPEPEDGPAAPKSAQELQERLGQAIAAAEQPPEFDISALDRSKDWTMEVRNLYYALLSQHPEYKYAYDLSAELDGDLLRCTVSYMPYRTGDYPAGFDGVAVSDMAALVETARTHLNQERVNIRITDPALNVDEMNRALQQVGGSYLLCQLSEDGTAVTVTPMNGMSRTEAAARLAEIDALAEQVYQECVSPGMSQIQQAQALYTYLTDTVRYDFRYYSQPEEMPYDSMTAYGALHEHLAICGGYAQAFQALLQRAGISCLTVSGKLGSENHMWDLAYVDGQWRYYDPTSDRGMSGFGFHYCGVPAHGLDRHTWDQAAAERMAGALFGAEV